MTLSKRDVLAVVAMIAGISGPSIALVASSLDVLIPGWGKIAIAVLTLASFGAGLITRTMTSNANTAAAALTGPAPSVDARILQPPG